MSNNTRRRSNAMPKVMNPDFLCLSLASPTAAMRAASRARDHVDIRNRTGPTSNNHSQSARVDHSNNDPNPLRQQEISVPTPGDIQRIRDLESTNAALIQEKNDLVNEKNGLVNEKIDLVNELSRLRTENDMLRRTNNSNAAL